MGGPISSAFVLFALAGLLSAQNVEAPVSAQPAINDAALEGVVVSSVGGAPLRKATVHLFSSDETQKEEGETAIADAQGHFSFTGLPARDYTLSASHPGYVTPSLHGENAILHYTLATGQQIKDIVVRLTPAAVLRGRVTDADGDPVDQIDVVATPVGKKSPAGESNTNDLGEFRIYNLPPGRYYVQASPRTEMSGAISRSSKTQTSVYVPTFYPATTNRSTATALDARAGDEVSVNIALLQANLYPVSGILLNGKGAPLALGVVTAVNEGSDAGGIPVTDGKFEMRLPAGHYTLIGMGIPRSEEGSFGFGMMAGQGPVPAQARKTIDVPEGGLRNIELRIPADKGPMVQVSGHVRVEDGSALPKGCMVVQLRERPSTSNHQEDEDDAAMEQRSAGGGFIKPDGTFEVKSVPPNTYQVVVFCNAVSTQDWYTKAVNVNGHDILNSGLTVSDSDLQLDVVLSPRGGSVEGTVKDKDDHALGDVRVVLVPDESKASRRDLYQMADTDQNGKFSVRGLEPGAYTAYAFDDDDFGVWFKPETLKQYKDYGVPVNISAAEKSHLDLHLAVSKDQDAQ